MCGRSHAYIALNSLNGLTRKNFQIIDRIRSVMMTRVGAPATSEGAPSTPTRSFYIDLLFFNWVQSRFGVVELKIGRFEPEYVGKLGFYVSWVDDNLHDHNQHAPTIGLLLCAGRNDNVVRYSLAETTAPPHPRPWPTTPTTPCPRRSANLSPPTMNSRPPSARPSPT